MSFVTDLKAQTYLKRFKPRAPKNFKEVYPSSSDESLDLLKKMLQFNPYFRPTVNECLAHPYFKDVTQFSTAVDAKQLVDLEMEYK